MLGVLRPEDQCRMALRIEIVAAVGRHRVCERAHDLDRVGLHVLGHAVRRLGIDDRDDAVRRLEAALDVQRLPRIGRLVLRDAVGVFARMGVLAEIDLRRHGAAEIDQHKPQTAADGGVGAPARTENAVAIVEAKLTNDRTVDDQERRARMRRGLPVRQSVLLFQHRGHRGDDHRQVGGEAARHHGVDRDVAQRGNAHGRGHHADHVIGTAPGHAR